MSGFFFRHQVVKGGVAGDFVLFFCPGAKVNEFAAFAAEGAVFALWFPLHRFGAGWALDGFFHGLSQGNGTIFSRLEMVSL